MSHPLPERVKKSVRLDIQAIAIISDYAAKHGCNETDALNRLILATQEPAMSHPPLITSHPLIETSHPLPPTATHELLVDRVFALENQMSSVIDRLDLIDRDKTHPIAPPLDIGLEPVAIDSKRSPKSIRDLDKGGTSTSEFTQYVEPLLRAYLTKGRYFRLDWLEQSELEQPRLKLTLQKQAKQLGFKSEPIKVDGLKIRVWLNRDYCLHRL